jgi:hypothetical protein
MPTEVVNPAFNDYALKMRREDPTISHMFDMGNGEYLCVKRLMFHWTLLRGTVGDMDGYDDRWCYKTQEGALHAVSQWAAAKFAGEPNGWHRHHKTGRRRTNGDPATEYIQH